MGFTVLGGCPCFEGTMFYLNADCLLPSKMTGLLSILIVLSLPSLLRDNPLLA